MAVLTGTRAHSKVEKGVKPSAASLVDKGLNTLMAQWKEAEGKAQGYFKQVVEYCAENDVSLATLETALINIRGIAPQTAKVEASKILKTARIDEVRVPFLDGKITTAQAKKEIGRYRKEKGEYILKDAESPDLEVEGDKKLQKVAAFFISELQMLESSDFVAAAKSNYKIVFTRIEAKARKAEELGDGEENEQEEDE
jgi:hypothetical protein